MPFNLSGKNVLVTGASSGIGRACAVAFAVEGANVILASRSKEGLEQTKSLLPKTSAQIHLFPLDITDRQQVKNLFQYIKNEAGAVDILVNNAGSNLSGAVDLIDLDKLDYIFKLNFLAPLWCMQEVIPIMKSRNSGHIINVSSIAGKRGFPFMGAYCASKSALNSITESLRVELYNTNVKVLLVCPGGTNTGFYPHTLCSTPQDFKLPTENLMSPEQVAQDILEAAGIGKREIVIGTRGRIMVTLSKISCTLTDYLLSKVFRT